MRIDEITGAIIGAALAVYRETGPGLLESAYQACMVRVLTSEGLRVRCQVAVPLIFMGERLECSYRMDMLVEEQVVVEIKSVAKLESVHFAQLKTYLKLSGCKVGLLINFNETRLMSGIRRVVLDYQDPPRPPPALRPSA